MRTTALYSLLFLSLFACSHAPTPSREVAALTPEEAEREKRVTELRTQAHAFYRRGDYLRAIPYFEMMVHLNEHALKSEDRFSLGYSYLSVGESLKAEDSIRAGIKLAPYQPMGYQMLGLASLAQGKLPAATENFRRGLEFDSHPPKMHFYLGLAYGKQGKMKERDKEMLKAEEEYETILLQNAYDFGANFELAYIYLTLGHKITKVEELIDNARTGLKESDPELVEGGTLYTQFYLPMIQGMEAYRKNETKRASMYLMQAALASPPGAKTDLAEIFHFLAANEKAGGATETSNAFQEMSKTLDPTAQFVSNY